MARIFNWFPIILLFLPILSFGQFSIESRFNLPLTQDEEMNPFEQHAEISIHYWTRLKDIRIEFLPGLVYQNYLSSNDEVHGYGVTLPALFYILDMINDCDCPTFSKNDYLVQKGLFLRAAPSFFKTTSKNENFHSANILAGELNIGLDLGVSDLLTITPLLGYKQQFYPNSNFESNGFIQVGISFLFRPDYRRRYR